MNLQIKKVFFPKIELPHDGQSSQKVSMFWNPITVPAITETLRIIIGNK